MDWSIDPYRNEPCFPYCLPSHDHANAQGLSHPLSEFELDGTMYLYEGSMYDNTGHFQYVRTLKDRKDRTFRVNEDEEVFMHGRWVRIHSLPDWSEENLAKLAKCTIVSKEEAHAHAIQFGAELHIARRWNKHWFLVRVGPQNFQNIFFEDLKFL